MELEVLFGARLALASRLRGLAIDGDRGFTPRTLCYDLAPKIGAYVKETFPAMRAEHLFHDLPFLKLCAGRTLNSGLFFIRQGIRPTLHERPSLLEKIGSVVGAGNAASPHVAKCFLCLSVGNTVRRAPIAEGGSNPVGGDAWFTFRPWAVEAYFGAKSRRGHVLPRGAPFEKEYLAVCQRKRGLRERRERNAQVSVSIDFLPGGRDRPNVVNDFAAHRSGGFVHSAGSSNDEKDATVYRAGVAKAIARKVPKLPHGRCFTMLSLRHQ